MKITLNIPSADHQKIKEAAAAVEMNTENFILGCVQAYLHPNKTPNAVTSRALRESSRSSGLISYNSIEDMVQDLRL